MDRAELSKAAFRTRILSQHLQPIVQEIFGYDAKLEQHQQNIQNRLVERDSRELSIASFAAQQHYDPHPWLHICVENFIDNDSFFSKLYDKPSASKISGTELNSILRATARALRTGAVRPEQLTKLVLEGTSFDQSILFNELIPMMSHVSDVNLSGTAVDDASLAALASALPTSAVMQRLVLANTTISDAGLFALLSKLRSLHLLSSLDLSHTRVTHRAVEMLLSLLPAHSVLSNLCLDGINLEKNLAESLLLRLPKLSKVTCAQGQYVKFRDNIVLLLPSAQASEVASLSFAGTNITPAVLDNILSIYGTQELKSLDLEYVQTLNLDELCACLKKWSKKLKGLCAVNVKGVPQGTEHTNFVQLEACLSGIFARKIEINADTSK